MLYMSIMAEPRYPDVAGIFEVIAADDVIMLRELGRLILELGENPRITANTRTPHITCTAESEACPDSFKTVIGEMIEAEEMLLKEYNEIIPATSDRAVTDTLTRIISAHDDHIKRLKGVSVHKIPARQTRRAGKNYVSNCELYSEK